MSENPTNLAADTVEKVKTSLAPELKEKQGELKERLDALYADKHAEKIFWSVRERIDLVKKLKAEMNGQKRPTEILGLISREIENELAENTFDRAAEDYEGSDSDRSEADRNQTRQTIEKAWEEHTVGLTPEQKAKLQKEVALKIESAGRDLPSDREKIFKDIRRTNWMNDKMVTKEEAEKIAEFIKTESEKMRTTQNKNETGKPADQKIEETEKRLRQIKIPNLKDGKFEDPGAVSLGLVPDGELSDANKKIDAIAEKFGLDAAATKAALKKMIALNLTHFGDKNNQKKIMDNFQAFEKYCENPENKKPLDSFFNLKGIENWRKNPDWLVRYFAFNEVQKDLETFDEWKKLQKEKKGSVPKVEKPAKPEIEQGRPTDTTETKDFDKAFSLFEKGDYLGALLAFLSVLLFEKIGGWLKEKFGDSLAGKAMKKIKEASNKIFGKSETPEAKAELAKEIKKSEPLLKFFGFAEKDYPAKYTEIKTLNNINVDTFLKAKDAEFVSFKDKNKISLDKDSFFKLQTQLSKKTISAEDKKEKVTDLILKKPELLK